MIPHVDYFPKSLEEGLAMHDARKKYEHQDDGNEEAWMAMARRILSGEFDTISTRKNRNPPIGSLRTAMVNGLRHYAKNGNILCQHAIKHLGLTPELALKE